MVVASDQQIGKRVGDSGTADIIDRALRGTDMTVDRLKELRKIGYRSVCLGSYVPWDVKWQSKIIHDELGWEGDLVENVPPGYNYEKIECYMQGVRDYIKYIKRGYTRPTHLASIDIRHDRLAREEGLDMLTKYEGKKPASLEIFLEMVGLSEAEFFQIAQSHTVSPWKMNVFEQELGTKLPDHDKWSNAGPMQRSEAEKQLDRWKKTTS